MHEDNMPDLPGLNFDHGEDILALRDSVRQYAQAEIAPLAADIDRSDRFPPGLWQNSARSVCWASRPKRNTAALRWDILRTSWRWRKSRAHRRRLVCRTARNRICA